MNHQRTTEFEWDAAKSDECHEERGFDFSYTLRAFLHPDRIVQADHRWNYGEVRFRLTGAAKALLKVLDKAPQSALPALAGSS